jgi:hypothetical protein
VRRSDLPWRINRRILIKGLVFTTSDTPHEATIRRRSRNSGDACGVSL